MHEKKDKYKDTEEKNVHKQRQKETAAVKNDWL